MEVTRGGIVVGCPRSVGANSLFSGLPISSMFTLTFTTVCNINLDGTTPVNAKNRQRKRCERPGCVQQTQGTEEYQHTTHKSIAKKKTENRILLFFSRFSWSSAPSLLSRAGRLRAAGWGCAAPCSLPWSRSGFLFGGSVTRWLSLLVGGLFGVEQGELMRREESVARKEGERANVAIWVAVVTRRRGMRCR